MTPTCPFGGVNLAALERMFQKTCCRRWLSPITSSSPSGTETRTLMFFDDHHRTDNLEGGVDDVQEDDRPRLQAKRAAANAGDVENVGHQLRLNPHVPGDRVDRPHAQLVVSPWTAQELGPAEHRVQRGPQLVREVGQELILRPIRFLGLPARFLFPQQLDPLLFRAFAIGDVEADSHHSRGLTALVDGHSSVRRQDPDRAVMKKDPVLEGERLPGLDRPGSPSPPPARGRRDAPARETSRR